MRLNCPKGFISSVMHSWLKRMDTWEQLSYMSWLSYVQVAAAGEGPVEAAAGSGRRPERQQQNVGPGQNSGRDVSHLGKRGRPENLFHGYSVNVSDADFISVVIVISRYRFYICYQPVTFLLPSISILACLPLSGVHRSCQPFGMSPPR